MSSGDLIAQTCFEHTPMSKIDWLRTARFGLIGATFVGPTIRIWFLKLEKLVGSGVTVQKTLSKVALDQLCFAPAFQVPILAYIGLLQGQNLSQIHVKIKRELKDIILTGWKVSSVQHVSIHLKPKIRISVTDLACHSTHELLLRALSCETVSCGTCGLRLEFLFSMESQFQSWILFGQK